MKELEDLSSLIALLVEGLFSIFYSSQEAANTWIA